MTDFMQSIWLENRQVSLREVPVPSLQESGEACIRVQLAGICATDLELIKGYYPYCGILGHEFVGRVVSCADSNWIGQRVVGEINIGCKKCEYCMSNRSRHCPDRKVLGIVDWPGAFAEYLKLPLENLHRVPDSISDGNAVFVEPLAAACRILTQVEILPEQEVLLLGAGRLGQLIARVLAETGCRLRVVARHPEQKQVLASWGIACSELEQLPSGYADLVIEATGSPEGFRLARQKVRPQGTVVLKSTYKEKTELDLASLVVDEINVVGSRCGPFAKALDLLAAWDLSQLIEFVYPLAEGLQALEHAARPGGKKIRIKFLD